jgi:hypothetical protein
MQVQSQKCNYRKKLPKQPTSTTATKQKPEIKESDLIHYRASGKAEKTPTARRHQRRFGAKAPRLQSSGGPNLLIDIRFPERWTQAVGTALAQCRRSVSNFAIVEILRTQGGCTDLTSDERIKDENFYQQRPRDACGHGACTCPWRLQPQR